MWVWGMAHTAEPLRELERLQVGLPRMRREPRRRPGDLVGIGEPVRRQRPGAREQDQLDAIDDPQRVADGLDATAEVEERLAVHRRDGVEEDEVADAVDRPVGGAGDHQAAVAVADEHDVVEVLVEEDVGDVGDVRLEVDVRQTAGASARPGR